MIIEQFKELIAAIILGAIQGVTEFLPISSTVHLGIASDILGQDLGIYATNLISLGTTVAIIQYFWKDILLFVQGFKNPRQWLEIGLATTPIILTSLLLSKQIEGTFRTMFFFGLFLITGALVLAFAEWYHKKKSSHNTKLSLLDYTIIGLFQALAVFPGMSRSGSTLAGGLLIAKDRATIVKASFWLSVPAFILAGVYSTYKMLQDTAQTPQLINQAVSIQNLSWLSIFVGAVTAYWVGLQALKWLIPYLSKHTSTLFIVYRLIVGAALIAISVFWR